MGHCGRQARQPKGCWSGNSADCGHHGGICYRPNRRLAVVLASGRGYRRGSRLCVAHGKHRALVSGPGAQLQSGNAWRRRRGARRGDGVLFAAGPGDLFCVRMASGHGHDGCGDRDHGCPLYRVFEVCSGRTSGDDAATIRCEIARRYAALVLCAHLQRIRDWNSRHADMDGGLRDRCLYRSEEHTSELQSLAYLVCRLLLEKKKNYTRKSSCAGWEHETMKAVSRSSFAWPTLLENKPSRASRTALTVAYTLYMKRRRSAAHEPR